MGSGFEPKFYQSATVTQFNVLEFGPHECLTPPLNNALSTLEVSIVDTLPITRYRPAGHWVRRRRLCIEIRLV